MVDLSKDIKTDKKIYMLVGNRYDNKNSNSYWMNTYLSDKENVIDCREENLLFYDGIIGNDHHIRGESLFNIIFPKLADAVGINYSADDWVFTYIPCESDKYNQYIIKPKKDTHFSINIDGTIMLEGGWDCLNDLDGKYDEWACHDTIYHRQYNGIHKCGKITNMEGEKTLLLSGDSHLGPLVPLFAYYFKEVVFMDNRTNNSYKFLYEHNHYDYVLLEFWEGRKDYKTLYDNLK